jgi:epidermal growth factor receptor substrate 15
LEQEQNTVKVLHTKIEPLQKTIAERESQYRAAIALTDSLNLQVQTLETQKGEWQALETDLRQQLANLENLEQQAKSQGEVLTAQLQTLEGQIKTLEESLEKDRQGFLNAQTQWESDRQGLEMVQKNQELAYQSLKSQFALLQQQYETLNADKTQQESQLQLEQSKVADLERQLIELQVSIILADDDDESEEIQEEEEPSTLPNDELENEPILLAETVTERETPADTVPAATVPDIVTEVSPVATLETSEHSPETQTATPEIVPTETFETSLVGKKFIILGTLNQINRDRAKDLIQTAGGTLMSSPSAKTDYALVGKSPGEKLKKVQKLGISQLSESQFLKLLGIES